MHESGHFSHTVCSSFQIATGDRSLAKRICFNERYSLKKKTSIEINLMAESDFI